MSESSALLALDATGQAEAVRSGLVTARELLSLSLARIEEADAAVNAVVFVDEDAAERAGAPAGAGSEAAPFAGVPILLKDLGAAAVGHPDHQGSVARKDAGCSFDHDSAVVRRLRAGGFVPIGRTNSAEFGLHSETRNLAYGLTRNPWDVSRSAGGSSGGSAAAVAAGMTALAQGTDGGGSLRNPAAHCGLVALKVSRGTISGAPGGESLYGISQTGVLTRSVRDARAVLALLAGREPGDAVVSPGLVRGGPSAGAALGAAHEAAHGAAARPLRIGVLDHDPGGVYDVSPEIRSAVLETAGLLEGLGHVVEPAWPAAMFVDDFAERWFAALLPFAKVARDRAAAAAEAAGATARFDPITEHWAALAASQTSAEHVEAMGWFDGFRRRVQSWWQEFDVLLCPVLPLQPQPAGQFADGADGIAESIRILRFTPQANMTGLPAVSVPAGFAGGVPVGVQLVGAYGADLQLLDLAESLEEARPWRTSVLAPA
ncbi:amidase [Herbiconiux sp. CPCC 203407]|uniref:Amidase n=1 Tax=Herbiconiux oxytropis TaxID=2970915 RepID=A0AA42BV01_9MICO|nr:amidase [Herbiconiux oxytropis]MCS5721662.1 amidase [Herbiconiux oxytropis]MCS5726711.1 amidase [Herbiconiux oxytropis]